MGRGAAVFKTYLRENIKLDFETSFLFVISINQKVFGMFALKSEFFGFQNDLCKSVFSYVDDSNKKEKLLKRFLTF